MDDAAGWWGLADRVLPVLGFVLAITVVAEISDRLGVFESLARRAGRLAGGSVRRLWLLVVLLAVACTAVLSLDTTAVLLTPVVLALARRHRLDARLFALTTVWLANTASLLLPVANLTNLLAVQRLGLSSLEWLRAAGAGGLVLVALTVLALGLRYRRSLRGRYRVDDPEPGGDHIARRVATVVCLALGPVLLTGLPVWVVAAAGALVLLGLCLLRARPLLGTAWRQGRLLPWRMLLGVALLFTLVQLGHQHGLDAVVVALAGPGEGFGGLLRLAAVAAVASNLVNNLPAYLALEPAAEGVRATVALLVGTNAGPLLTPWASLATLLWAARCRAAGVDVSWARFLLAGLLVVPVLVLGAVAVLWLQPR